MKRTLILLLLLPLSCVLPSDRGQRRDGDVLRRLELEREEQRREAAKLRSELAKVRQELLVKERAEQERKQTEKARKLAEEKARERERLDARFAKVLKRLEDLRSDLRRELAQSLETERKKDLGEGLRKEMDQRGTEILGELHKALRDLEEERGKDRQKLMQWIEKRLSRVEKKIQTPERPWKNELGSLSLLLDKERRAAAKDRESAMNSRKLAARDRASLRKDLEAFIEGIQASLAGAAKERKKLADKIKESTTEVDFKALVKEVLQQLRPLVKREVQKDLKASLESLQERSLRTEAVAEKRAKDLDLKMNALGKAVDSLVRAVRALRREVSANSKRILQSGNSFQEEGGGGAKASKKGAIKEETSKKGGGKKKRTHPSKEKAGKRKNRGGESPAPIRRRKAGIPSFGEGNGFFERPEYWVPSLVGLLFIFVLLGRKPRTGKEASPLVGGRYLPRPSEGSPRASKRHGMEPRGDPVPIPKPEAKSAPSPMHLSLRIPSEDLSPGGEEAVRAYLASESMVLVRPEPRVDRRGDGSLSIRFYIPGGLPPHLRRELRECCESLAMGQFSSPSN